MPGPDQLDVLTSFVLEAVVHFLCPVALGIQDNFPVSKFIEFLNTRIKSGHIVSPLEVPESVMVCM